MMRSSLSFRGAVPGVWLFLGAFALASAACSGRPAPADDSAAAQEQQDEHLASRGFYHRRAQGLGWFITRREPGMARSRNLSDVLRLVPGINVVPRNGGAHVVSSRSAVPCPLAVFVDGSYTTIRNVDELSLEDLEALEVYRGPAEVPAGFTAPLTARTCGALLVWSRIEVGDD